MTDFNRHPDTYRHWHLELDAPIAWLTLAVDPQDCFAEGYELKLNSYDLGVDIELRDVTERLRFEHPEIRTVVMTGGLDGVFCAGANIRMLAGSTHGHKVNFCKFTNETRNAIENASAHSGQRYLAALNGAASGGGYELALACDHILLVDDRNSAVSLPEVPMLGVLPGTGGLTRVTDKRGVRRDLADVFATRAEGSRGEEAVRWGLVDELAPRSTWEQSVRDRALAMAADSDRPTNAVGVLLPPVEPEADDTTLTYRWVRAQLHRDQRFVELIVTGPDGPPPDTPDDVDAASWLVACARQLDDLLLHLRFDETELGTIVLRTEGDLDLLVAHDEFLAEHGDHWLMRETSLLWGRVFKRLDLTARSLIAVIEPGSCFGGLALELALAADRSYMLDGIFEDDDEPAPAAELAITASNLGPLPMSNGLSRLASRFWGDAKALDAVGELVGHRLDTASALVHGLVTFAPDDLDWADEVRLAIEERASFSPDALTGMEANHRFVGPETVETKIFARLTAWQNWIFQRPNAAGPDGALRRYGSGSRPSYDYSRV